MSPRPTQIAVIGAGEGSGEALEAAAEVGRLLAEAGAGSRFTLEVRVSNIGAIAMYEQLGFRRAGRRRRYYSDNGEDAMIMWLGEPGF